MIRIVSRFLVKSWRPNFCVSRIEEGEGTFTVYLPYQPDKVRFTLSLCKGLSLYGLALPYDIEDGGHEFCLNKAIIVYYSGEEDREEFLRRVRGQRYFLELDEKKRVIKRYG